MYRPLESAWQHRMQVMLHGCCFSQCKAWLARLFHNFFTPVRTDHASEGRTIVRQGDFQEREEMSLKNTACLAALLTSLPLIAPTASVSADDNYWDKHPDIQTSGNATSSGTSKEEPHLEKPDAGTYAGIFIGHAETSGTEACKAEANYNKGEIGNEFKFEGSSYCIRGIYGGYAQANFFDSDGIEVEAKGNSLILQNGGSEDRLAFYGGYARNYTHKTGTANASENTVTIEKGFIDNGSLNVTGGYATTVRGYATATASDNIVTFEDGACSQKITVNVGVAYGVTDYDSEAGSEGTADITASGNKLNIKKMTNATVYTLCIGRAWTAGLGKAIAEKNIGTLVFGENVTITYGVTGGLATHIYNEGQANANENQLNVTGGTFLKTASYNGFFYTGQAWGEGELNANRNITSFTSVDHRGVVAGGYASERSTRGVSTVYANNNVTTITNSTINEANSGYAGYGLYAEAQENTLSISGGSSSAVYAGQAFIQNVNSPDSKKETYAYKNTLTLQGTVVSEYAYAGYSKALNSSTSADISVSAKKATAEENTLTVAGGSAAEAYAGYALSDNDATSLQNKVYLNYDSEQSTNLDSYFPPP